MELAQDVLAPDISSTDDAGANQEIGLVALEPALYRVEHWSQLRLIEMEVRT